MIALEFAPVQTTGAFRSIDLARYLPEHGIDPTVLTIEPDYAAQTFGAKRNDALLSGLPSTVRVQHLQPAVALDPRSETPLARWLRMFGNLDDTFFKRFERSLREQVSIGANGSSFDAVYASLPPFGAGRLAELASRLLGKPLILDMRDAWSAFEQGPSMSYAHHVAKVRGEARALASATAVITVTDRLADLFRFSHPSVPSNRFHVVPNGFDGPLFESEKIPPQQIRDEFHIAYVGTYYYQPRQRRTLRRPHTLLQYSPGQEDWSYRSPLYFFKAWRELAKRDPDTARRIRFHHIGNVPSWLEPMLSAHGLASQSKLWGSLPKHEVAPVLDGMDAQLATSMKRIAGGDYCLASKTFDYVKARKPILGFVTEGSQKDFLVQSGGAIICDPDDAAASAETMRRLVLGELPSLELNVDFLNRFHRRNAARQTAMIIDSVTRGGREMSRMGASARKTEQSAVG
ncbi:MAG: glycosyltransferase [Hyphomicrobiaceae bacterium]